MLDCWVRKMWSRSLFCRCKLWWPLSCITGDVSGKPIHQKTFITIRTDSTKISTHSFEGVDLPLEGARSSDAFPMKPDTWTYRKHPRTDSTFPPCGGYGHKGNCISERKTRERRRNPVQSIKSFCDTTLLCMMHWKHVHTDLLKTLILWNYKHRHHFRLFAALFPRRPPQEALEELSFSCSGSSSRPLAWRCVECVEWSMRCHRHTHAAPWVCRYFRHILAPEDISSVPPGAQMCPAPQALHHIRQPPSLRNIHGK